MDLELLKHANNYIEKMANGINPLTDKKCNDNDMINNVRISRCLFYVSKVLDDVIKNNNKKRTSGSIPFYMDNDTIKRYRITDEKLSISKVASEINELKTNDNMKKIPLIIFSSLVNEEMRIKGKQLGADAQLTKPEIGNLVEAIDNLIDKSID